MTTGARAAFAIATATIVAVGFISVVRGGPVQGRGEFDAVFFGLLALFLLPTVIYGVGVFRPDSVLYFGLALLLTTAFAWAFVFVSNDAFRAVFTPLAFLVTLVTSMIGAARDHASKEP